MRVVPLRPKLAVRVDNGQVAVDRDSHKGGTVGQYCCCLEESGHSAHTSTQHLVREGRKLREWSHMAKLCGYLLWRIPLNFAGNRRTLLVFGGISFLVWFGWHESVHTPIILPSDDDTYMFTVLCAYCFPPRVDSTAVHFDLQAHE